MPDTTDKCWLDPPRGRQCDRNREHPLRRCVICRLLFCWTHIHPDAHWCEGEPKQPATPQRGESCPT